MQLNKWVQASQFSVDFPDGWLVTQAEDSTEIVPESGDAAVHISVFARPDSADSSEHATRELMTFFAKRNELEIEGPLKCFREDDVWTCHGCFENAGSTQRPAKWSLRVILTKSKAIVGSLCSDDVNSRSWKQGGSVLMSLAVP